MPVSLGQTPTPQLEPVRREYDFYAHGPYRAELPRPAALLGYEPGEFYANYGAVERVLRAYAAGSDRVRLMELGRTNEFRTLYLLAVSSPRNLARLEEIRAANQRLADPRVPLAGPALERAVTEQPIIVWLSYNVHGDEAAGTEAALQVLYQLAASEAPEWRDWLERVVVLIAPCQNPDGRERFVSWYNAHGVGRPETFAFEKENPWHVAGRFNHYYFDLNRDMLVTSQRESRVAAAAFLAWRPQVLADHHGETKEYFFPPAALPINANLPRASFERWLEVFGRGNAAAFDAHGWLYYVRDVFDTFYPGYWDSWPALHGATGMTYETSGGGKRGRNHRRDDETTMTLRAAIAKHVAASLATVRTAAAHREARLRDFRADAVAAMTPAEGPGAMRQVFISAARDPHRAAELVGVLRRNGVEVRRTTAAVEVPDARAHGAGPDAAPSGVMYPAGTYTIDLVQPAGRVAKALLEPASTQDEPFLARQEEKRRRNRERGENVAKEDYEFYDMTAWSLPLMFGVEASWSPAVVAVTDEIVTEAAAPVPPAPARANTAYVFTPETEGGLRLALQLLGEGYRLATAVRPLQAAGREWPRGAFIARVERNPESLHAKMVELAARFRVAVQAVDTAFTERGITGIGSEATYALRAPKVAVLAGEPTSPSSYGSLRFLFEQTYGVDHVPVSVRALGGMRLSDFNVIVLPSGSVSGYRRHLGADGAARLRTWVEQGGILICLGGAAEYAVEVGWTTAKRVGAEDEEEDAGGDAAKNGTKTAGAEEEKESEPLPVPGALLRAAVNHDHWLTFGYAEATLPVLVNTDAFFEATETGMNVLRFVGEDLHVAGHIWRDNTERLLRDTAALIDEPVGDGHVLVFADEPGYRQIWHATTRMLINGLLYGPALRGEAVGYFAR